MTPAESRLWDYIRCRQLSGFKFRRQAVIKGYVADFYCPEKLLIVEVDGGIHKTQIEQDKIRDSHLSKAGFKIIRVTNDLVFKDIIKALNIIREALYSRPHKLMLKKGNFFPYSYKEKNILSKIRKENKYSFHRKQGGVYYILEKRKVYK